MLKRCNSSLGEDEAIGESTMAIEIENESIAEGNEDDTEAKRVCVKDPDDNEEMMDGEALEKMETLMKTDGSGMAKAADLKVICEGDVNRVPLTLASDGNKAWARRREPPHKLQMANLSQSHGAKWVDTKQSIDLGHQGLTRCGALGNYFIMQRHQDGMIVFTDGEDFNEFFYLFLDKHENELSLVKNSEYKTLMRKPTNFAVCTAMACVGNGLGFAAVIEDYGLVYVNIAPFVYPPFSIHAVDTSCPGNIITSLAVCANQLAYCIGNGEHEHTRTLVICNVLELESRAHLRIPTMDPITNTDQDEQIWQVALQKDCASVTTTERCLWVTLQSKKWRSSVTKGVVASCISQMTRNIAFLTVLGDCFMIHADCNRLPQRLKEGSQIQPFYTSHTRDGVIAWGSDGCSAYEVVRIIKSGGEIHQVSKGYIH